MIKKRALIFSIVSLAIFGIFLLGLTANFNRVTYVPNIKFLIFQFIYVAFLIINGFYFIAAIRNPIRRIPLLLILFNFLIFIHITFEFLKPEIYRGWIYPDVWVSKTKNDKILGLSYRLRCTNYRQINIRILLELLNNKDSNKIPVKNLEDHISGGLMYVGDEPKENKENDNLFPSSMGMFLKERNDSIFFYLNFNINEVLVSYIDINHKEGIYLKTLNANIINDTLVVSEE